MPRCYDEASTALRMLISLEPVMLIEGAEAVKLDIVKRCHECTDRSSRASGGEIMFVKGICQEFFTLINDIDGTLIIVKRYRRCLPLVLPRIFIHIYSNINKLEEIGSYQKYADETMSYAYGGLLKNLNKLLEEIDPLRGE
jgi:hypothetical protein